MSLLRGYPRPRDPYSEAIQRREAAARWELLRDSQNDLRIFRSRENGLLYICDHSGLTPDVTVDGPLQIVTPNEIHAHAGCCGDFIINVVMILYSQKSYVRVGMRVAFWLAAYYNVPIALGNGDAETYCVTHAKPMPGPWEKRPERRINIDLLLD